MKKGRFLKVAALFFAVFVSSALAQDKPKPQQQQPEEFRFILASLRVQIVFTEYEGEKKLKSLPYTFLVTTRSREGMPESKIRIGNKVPVYTGGEHGVMTYVDVGTNIDCWAEGVTAGQYRVYLSLERSWVEGAVSVPVEKTQPAGDAHPAEFSQPIIRQYKAELSPVFKDGQSLETNLATDPLSGRVVKLEVSISVLK